MNCKHTTAPTGYLQWHEWAKEKSKAYSQIKCPGCGLFKVWVRSEKCV